MLPPGKLGTPGHGIAEVEVVTSGGYLRSPGAMVLDKDAMVG